MELSLRKNDLVEYVQRQISHFFSDGTRIDGVQQCMDEALDRVSFCFSSVYNRYFRNSKGPLFNHLNGDHYSMFLYFLSNTMFKNEFPVSACDKVFLLNKVLNSIDVYYEVELPRIFLFCHAIGTVLGRAEYSDYLLIHQNCTVGANHITERPKLGMYAALYKGASVIGRCNVGNNCKISAHSLLLDMSLDDNSIYSGTPVGYVLKTAKYHDRIWDPDGHA